MTNLFEISLASESDAEQWNKFIAVAPGHQCVYNVFEWRNILIKSYGYLPYYIKAEQQGKIVGCFPLFQVNSRLFGKRLISVPFADHGCGPYAIGENTKILEELIRYAKIIGEYNDATGIWICPSANEKDKLLQSYGFEWSSHFSYATFMLNLGMPHDILFKYLKKRVRGNIRKAQRYGVRISVECDSRKAAREIYKIHVDNMKRLGTPCHSLKFFEEIFRVLGPKGWIRNSFAEYRGRRIAAVSVFPYGRQVRWGTGVQLSESRPMNPISLLLWDAIKWANDSGYESFDMGGSRVLSGNFSFKEGWVNIRKGTGQIYDVSPLYIKMRERFSKGDPREIRYLLASRLWSVFIPPSVAKKIGPMLRRGLAF